MMLLGSIYTIFGMINVEQSIMNSYNNYDMFYDIFANENIMRLIDILLLDTFSLLS